MASSHKGGPVPSIQDLLDIASQYSTPMADAMVKACIARALEDGTPLRIPERDGHGEG